MNQAANMLQSLRKLAQFDAELRNLSVDTEEQQEVRDKIESLRAPLPTAILGHYDRRKARGKPSIAPVRNGVCGACHLSIPSGRLADLFRKHGELNVCDNCGVFIYLTEEELAPRSGAAAKPIPVRKTLRSKRVCAKRV
jgi:predicted  nucleic acid-binding Zn-ribbon protein